MVNPEELLRKNGLKATKSRLEILSILKDSEAALSHSDITEKLGEMHIDKVTLYRTLNAFTEKNIVHKIASDDRNWKYALQPGDHTDHKAGHDDDHTHFVCNSCDRIFCFPMKPAIKPDTSVSAGFIVNTSELRLHGLCPTCQT